MTKPRVTPEEFANWRENSVTQWVMQALEKAAEENRQAWVDSSWGEGGTVGQADQALLIELHTRSDSYRILAESDWLVWAKTHGETE